MKTSNQLIIAFFVIVFSVPFLMLVGFRKSIQKEEFTFVPYNNQFSHKGEIKPYKFIKIVGPSRAVTVFSCRIIPSDSASYSYNTYQQTRPEDRVILKQAGDTLLVKYADTDMQGARNNQQEYYISKHIDLYLPFLNEIIVESATVQIDSINTANNPQISFDLRNHANLELGNFGHSQTVFGPGNIETELTGTMDSPSFDSTLFRERSGKLISLEIKANNSSITVGPYSWINHLQLQVNGLSQVIINNNSRIDQLSGFISDSTTVNGNWKNVRRLAALTTK